MQHSEVKPSRDPFFNSSATSYTSLNLSMRLRRCQNQTAHALDVSGRWQSIYQHFCDASVAYPQAKEVLDRVFHPRMAKQVVPMHWAAYYLDPTHAGSEISVECQKQVLDFIREHVPVNREAAALQSYFSYYHKEDEFASTNYCWQYTNKSNLF